MKTKKLKRLSLINLISGYIFICLFILLVALNRGPDVQAEEVVIVDDKEYADDLFNGVHKDNLVKERFYVDGHPVDHVRVIDRSVGRDHGVGIILDDDPDVLVLGDHIVDDVAVVRNPGHVVLRDRSSVIVDNDDRFIAYDENRIIADDNLIHETHTRDNLVLGHDGRTGNILRGDGRGDRVAGGRARTHNEDLGLLDRRLREQENDIGIVDVAALDRAIREDKDDDFGIDDNELTGLTLARDDDADFELDIDFKPEGAGGKGYGLDKGNLYAYNFPSQGVGAGIGNTAVGAGIGAAGIGAGIGEAVLNGQTVPTLGGIGTSPPLEGQPAEGAPGTYVPSDGVGGLVSGAGAGGAAGLTAKPVTEKLGLGIGEGAGGNGVGGNGVGGNGRHYDYDHLPKDGALHIMIHVDGSGSILSTRKQLDIMKETLLKDALLPYYNNDEGLYERRVTIVDSAGERTLQFFAEAATKDNVLAVAFQDEAAPDYHLPNFNKAPQQAYSTDLGSLKSNLNGYGGLYRGIMFQVDRGRTFAKSFKELVECAWRGEGYLANDSLKKYYWENNLNHIKNMDGIVFSDVYHTKSEGDPQYYLDLLFEASKKVGLDLDIYGAGLTDGKYNAKID